MKRKLKAVEVALAVAAAVALVAPPGFGQFKAAMATGQIIQPKVNINQATFKAIVFSPDGKGVWLTAGNAASLWDVGTGEMKLKYQYHSSDRPDWHMGALYSLAVSPDGKTMATGAERGEVKFWDPETGKVKATADLKSGEIRSVAYSPDGSVLAAAQSYSSSLINLVDPETGSVKATLEVSKNAGIHHVAYSPDGKLLAAAAGGNKVLIFDAKTGNPRKTLTISERNTAGYYQDVGAFAFSPDGKTLATGGSHSGFLLDVATGKIRVALPHEARANHEDQVAAVAFSRDGKLVATASQNGEAKLWDAATGKLKATLKGQYAFSVIAFSPDGGLVAAGASDSTKIYEVPGK